MECKILNYEHLNKNTLFLQCSSGPYTGAGWEVLAESGSISSRTCRAEHMHREADAQLARPTKKIAIDFAKTCHWTRQILHAGAWMWPPSNESATFTHTQTHTFFALLELYTHINTFYTNRNDLRSFWTEWLDSTAHWGTHRWHASCHHKST